MAGTKPEGTGTHAAVRRGCIARSRGLVDSAQVPADLFLYDKACWIKWPPGASRKKTPYRTTSGRGATYPVCEMSPYGPPTLHDVRNWLFFVNLSAPSQVVPLRVLLARLAGTQKMTSPLPPESTAPNHEGAAHKPSEFEDLLAEPVR